MSQIVSTVKSNHQPYNPNNNYWIFYDTNHSNYVTSIMGLLFPLEEINYAKPHIKSHLLGRIDETTFDVLNISCSTTALMAFFDPENDEVYYRKMYVELGDKTFYDVERECLVSLDNVIRMKIICKDDNEDPADDVTTVSFKNMNLLDDDETRTSVTINGENIRKKEINNGDEVAVGLLSNGKFNFRFKAVIPQITGMWLSMYISARKLTDDEIPVMEERFKDAADQRRYITPFTNPYVGQNNTDE